MPVVISPASCAGGSDGYGASMALKTRFYYVDEAGDPHLFNRKNQVIVGKDGCSRYFVLGKLDVAEPDRLAEAMTDLRRRLLADPYFAGVPSMAPGSRKTARIFHAKDDVGEVRREVFQLLMRFDVRFYAVVREKRVIAKRVQEHNQRQPAYRYHPNQLYDRCVPSLFEQRLHKDEAYRIVFAKRGSSDRTEAFERGLQQAKANFRQSEHVENAAPIEVVASDPSRIVCLQAVDYFLWATQRLFEKGERRYIDLIWSKVGLILDFDDTRHQESGELYSQERPLPDDPRA